MSGGQIRREIQADVCTQGLLSIRGNSRWGVGVWTETSGHGDKEFKGRSEPWMGAHSHPCGWGAVSVLCGARSLQERSVRKMTGPALWSFSSSLVTRPEVVSGWHGVSPGEMTSTSFPGVTCKNRGKSSKLSVLGVVWRDPDAFLESSCFPLLKTHRSASFSVQNMVREPPFLQFTEICSRMNLHQSFPVSRLV